MFLVYCGCCSLLVSVVSAVSPYVVVIIIVFRNVRNDFIMTTDAGRRGYVMLTAAVCVIVYIYVARNARRSAVIMQVLARRLSTTFRRTIRRTQP